MTTKDKIVAVVAVVSAIALIIISINSGTPVIMECGVNTPC